MSDFYDGLDLVQRKIYEDGVAAGIKQMMDKIQKNCSLGRPVMANEELYWLTDSRQHLLDIMDGIDNAYGIQRVNQYIVPIHKIIDGKCLKSKVIIIANIPYEAYHTAYDIFSKDSWLVYPNYGEYEHLK